MKSLSFLIFLAAIMLAFNAPAAFPDFNNLPNNTVEGRLSSSWDTYEYAFYGYYSDANDICMNPQSTIHPFSFASGGAGLAFEMQAEIPMRGIAAWGYGTNSYLHIGYVHITDAFGVDVNLPPILQAPTNLWNGTILTASTGWASTASILWIPLGMQPSESSDGGLGNVSTANNTSTNVAASYGYPWNDWWNVLSPSWSNDFAGQKLVWSGNLDHNNAAGGLNEAIALAERKGFETNVWTLSVNWDGSISATNHCTFTGVSKSGNTVSGTLLLARMMGGWDIPGMTTAGGVTTNDARNAFVVIPAQGNKFKEILRMPDAPDGAIRVRIDSGSFLTTGAALRAGINTYTNYNTGSVWAHKTKILEDLRNKRGAHPVTGVAAHSASGPGVGGLYDQINWDSEALSLWGGGSRGDALIAGMDHPWARDMWAFDTITHNDAQQTNRAVSFEFLEDVYVPAYGK